MPHTKIVCTLGPASSSPQVIERLIQAGMSAARLNFSHGSHKDHAAAVMNIRNVAEKLGRRVAILQDLSGPKIRLGSIAESPVQLETDARFVLTTRDVEGDSSTVSFNYEPLPGAVKPGERILLGDGLVELQVLAATGTDIVCTVLNGGPVASRQGIAAPGVALGESVPTAKDLEDLEFGIAHGVDFVAQSFVRTAAEVRALKDIIRRCGADVPVIVKVEKRECMENLPEIIAAADGVMVARGDLGLEIGLENVPFAQKDIIRAASAAGIPEITATQMLESMMGNPRPTRAEVSDVANAVLDGTEAVMLSGETAVGSYPVEACRTLVRAAAAAEARIDYRARFSCAPACSGDATDAVARAACQLAMETRAAAIICCTRSGLTARLVAKYRPQAPMAVASPHEKTLRRSLLLWGAHPVKTEMVTDTDGMIANAKKAVLNAEIAPAGSTVVIVAGLAAESATTTNTIKVDSL